MLELVADIGAYVEWWKLLLLTAAFYGWMPLVNWVHKDAQEVNTDHLLWTGIVVAAGTAGLVLWMLIPAFLIGLLLCLISVGAVGIAYVMHRNSKVADFERVLTAEHIRGMFVDQGKKLEKQSYGLSFITGNKNEVPIPAPKTREAEGYVLVCEIIDDALWRRADKVIFMPQKDDYTVIYEIDGIATKQSSRNKEEMDAFAYYTKQLGGLDVEEKRKPQQGRFRVVKDKEKRTEWQINASGSTAGEQLQLQKVSGMVSMKIDTLGLNENQIEPIKTLRKMEGGGLVIASGPAKNGVTTTFYTLLGNHDPFLNSINTLEKNPAGRLENITQNTFVLSDSATATYSRRLQTLLRRGPDIMGVADCEDAQSAKLACMAAKDGRIVYVTLAANSVAEAMDKWLKLVGDNALVAETLKAVLNQRLVRILCQDCRQPYQPNQALLKKFNIPAGEAGMCFRPGEVEYDKHGKPIVCQTCQGTGFYGRTGLFESICIDEQLKQAVKSAQSGQDAVAAFRRTGMLYMQEQAIKKVMQGITSINEVIRIFSAK